MTSSFVYVVGHRNPDVDSVCSAIAYAHLKNRLGQHHVRPARAGEIDAETEFVLQHFAVPVPEQLMDAAGHDLILVDHNEIAQSLPHIERANVLEVWEHHRLGDLRPPNPIVFHCEPVGATATLIGEQYALHEITPTRAMAGVMLAAILSDTVLFRSPTVTEKDRRIAVRLQRIAEVGPDFGEQMLERKTATVAERSVSDLIRGDYKEFHFGRERIGISQVEVVRPDALAAKKQLVLREMRALRGSLGLTHVVLMITDVERRSSDLWVIGERRDFLERAFGPIRDDEVHVPDCMSRKKQVVPQLERAIRDLEATERSGIAEASAPGTDEVIGVRGARRCEPPSASTLHRGRARGRVARRGVQRALRVRPAGRRCCRQANRSR